MVCCDVSEEFTNVARRYWKEAGVTDKIDLRIGPAIDSLADLVKEGQSGSFDFAFLDADKNNYNTYYERSLELLRPGGVIAIDNVFQHGRVSDPSVMTTNVEAVRALNKKIHGDTRVHSSMLPIGDGLTLALKI
jgi:caffeoyl-CoA O-methyltransferase